MTESERLAAPELELLLNELAARPRSIFLRADRKAAFRSLRSTTEERVSAFAVSDALERELLLVHRAELAEIVHQAIRTQLLEGARERLFITHYHGANERAETTGMAEIHSRMGVAAGAKLEEPWAGAIAALQRALAPEDPEGLSVLDLAALGQRLEPRGAWKSMSAMAYFVDGQHDAACRLARTVLDGWPEPEQALRALEMLALAKALGGDPGRALSLQQQACSLREEYPLGHANRFGFALLAGRDFEATEASLRLEQLVKPEHQLIEEYVTGNARRRRNGTWAPTEDARRAARRLESKVGRVARRLASVYE